MEYRIKPVKNYEGLYEVDTLGNVYSLNYNHTNRKRKLKPYKNRFGYLRVVLCKNGFNKKHSIHRLVAQTFIPNLYNKPQVNHIDGDKQNNSIENLEWCTGKENTEHAFLNKLCKIEIPIVAISAKTGEKMYFKSNRYAVRKLKEIGISVNSSGISKCCNGLQKYHKGYEWSFIKEEM